MDRALWIHLVSMHADGEAVRRTRQENHDQHEHEHRGPGIIRNHPVSDMSFNLDTARAVLADHIDDTIEQSL